MKRLTLIAALAAAPAAATYPGQQPYVSVQSQYSLPGTGDVASAVYDTIGPVALTTVAAQPGPDAYALAAFGALHARAAAGLADGTAPARFFAGMQGTSLYSEASFSDLTVTGATSLIAPINLYFDRTLAASLNPDRSFYLDDVLAFNSFYGYVPSTVVGAGLVDAKSWLSLFIIDYDAMGAFNGAVEYSVIDEIQLQDEAQVFNGAAYGTLYSVSANLESLVSIDAAGNRTILRDTLTTAPFDPVAPYQQAQNYGFDLLYEAGHSYGIDFRVACSVYTGGVGYQAGAASCDASKSAYWNGLTNVRDLNGRPLTNYTLTSASGFDYRYASPLSPAPASVAPVVAPGVPEPATWTLLVAGFGLVGTMRRRGVVAA